MKRDGLKNVLLIVAKAGGFVSISVLAPMFPYQVLKSHVRSKKFKKQKEYYLQRSLSSLQNKRLVSLTEKSGEIVINITEQGRRKVLEYKLDDMVIKPQKSWDKKWRLVIFDIPEEKKLARNILREKLKEIGFSMVQKSVFILPYPCKDEIDYIRELYELYKYVNYFEVSVLDAQIEKKLKNKYKLT